MAKTSFESVDEYLAAQPDAARRVLQSVRATLRKALPRAEESISYQIPAYKIDGRTVIYMSGWKAHYALYPVTDALRHDLGDELDSYVAAKGTLRFPLAARPPLALIARIAKSRAKEEAAKVKKPVKPRR